MRGLSVVFTHSVAYKGIEIACIRNPLTLKKYRSHHLDVCDQEEDCHQEDACHPEEELADGFVSYHRQPVFGSTRTEPSSCQANGWSGRCRTCSLGWSLGLAWPDSWYRRYGLLIILSLIMGPFGPELLSTRTQVISRLGRSAADVRMILGGNLIQACRCPLVIVDK